ncbi:MAG: hypothetical protein ACK41U_06930 [Paracoccus sp. (in: a-proteobacteria)]|uniref:hypothetical protein n=1 Tax=Paracoccus sp. TaxID=267 RepID=UPI0039195892
MPLPHFLLLIAAVLVAAGLTLWISLSAGVPMIVILLGGLSAALALHLSQRGHHHDPHA